MYFVIKIDISVQFVGQDDPVPSPTPPSIFLGFGNSHERLDWGWRHVPLTRSACYIVASVAPPKGRPWNRSISWTIESIDKRWSRVDRETQVESIDRANVKSSQSIISTWSRLLAVVQIQHEYNNNIVLTEVNKTVIFIVPNTYYFGHIHTLTHWVCPSAFMWLSDLGTYIFVKPVPIYDF